jgi:adenylate kinase
VHVVCSGIIYGNGELENSFYEHFRRSWLGLHPKLAALPVVGDGSNRLPTIHAHDLASFINVILEKKPEQQYFIATDYGRRSQLDIVKSISESLGSGAIEHFELGDILSEPWAEQLNLNLRIKPSKVLTDHIHSWRSKDGLTSEVIKAKVNTEFNKFRGLFPLKLFVTGPPAAGKSHFCEMLSREYGVPHIRIQDAIDLGLSLTDDFG